MAIKVSVQDEQIVEIYVQDEQTAVTVAEGALILNGGNSSAKIYLRIFNGYLQYSNDNEAWNNLVTVQSGQDYVLTDSDKQEIASLVPDEIYIGSGEMPDGYNVQIDPNYALPIARIAEVEIKASKWVGTSSPYSQVVSINGVTPNSQVDLTPSVEQLSIFYEKDLAFVTENVGGVVTVYAIGQKPQNDYIIQATITEVEYE